MKTSTRLVIPVLIVLAAATSACSGMLQSEQPAKQYYTLMPYTAGNSSSIESNPALLISVHAVPGLDTDRILQLGDDASLQRYANARWPDYLPEVLSSVIRRSLVSTGNFSTVEGSTRKDEESWTLTLEVQQFYGIRDSSGNTSSVLVELAGTLDCNGRTHPVSLKDSNTVSVERLSAIVAAHQAGLDRVTQQLIGQISDRCKSVE